MKYKVPKFIERETRILYFLTFKQFLLIAIPSILFLALFAIFKKSVIIIIGSIVLAISLSFAFLKIEGYYSLFTFLSNLLKHIFKPKIYIWQKGGRNFRNITYVNEKYAPEEKTKMKYLKENSSIDKISSKIQFGL